MAARLAAALALLLLTGCAAPPSRLPMAQLVDDGACPRTLSATLLVLLPGIHMTPAELVQQGFVDALRQRGLAVDVAVVGTEIGHAQDGSVLRRLRDEVLQPARARGYREIWLAGISLGAYLALQYERRHPGELQGLVLIAPYLGSPALTQQVAAAGGPAAWRRVSPAPLRAPEARETAADVDHALWAWLAELPRSTPPIWLAYGSDDRFAAAHRTLAALLPPDRVSSEPGGHDWAPWRRLWARWLDRGLLPAACP